MCAKSCFMNNSVIKQLRERLPGVDWPTILYDRLANNMKTFDEVLQICLSTCFSKLYFL